MSPAVDIWGKPFSVDGVTFRDVIPPGPQRDRALELLKAQLIAVVDGLDRAVDELQATVARHDPLELLDSVAIPTSMVFRSDDEAFEDSPETYTWPAKVEYLAGLTLTGPPGRKSVPTETTRRVFRLLRDIFDASRAKVMLQSWDAPKSADIEIDMATYMLRLEHLFDRMPGYATHLERIDEEIFGRHRDYYVRELGFSPADVVRVVRRRIDADSKRASNAINNAKDRFGSVEEAAALAMAEMFDMLELSRRWNSVSLAQDSEVPIPEAEALLRFFASSFESQPNFRYPGDPNVLRTRALINLHDGSYYVPDPWSLIGVVHARLAQEADRLVRYRSHREDGHERVVVDALTSVFGSSRVHDGVHYASSTSGPGEIDALVECSWPLVVEGKARSLTDVGRRGLPRRVVTVTEDVVEKALDQTGRARAYIEREDGRRFAEKQGGSSSRRLPDDIDGVTEIVVTFERMDPLALSGLRLTGDVGREVWFVSLSDFLMVADVLRWPAAFHHYARSGRPYQPPGSTSTWSLMRWAETPSTVGGADNYCVCRLPGVSFCGVRERRGDRDFTELEVIGSAEPSHLGFPNEVIDALTDAIERPNGLGLWRPSCQRVAIV